MPNPSQPQLWPLEKGGSREARAALGVEEKLSRSRVSVRKMEADSEVKGKSKSLGVRALQGSRRLSEGLARTREKRRRSQ